MPYQQILQIHPRSGLIRPPPGAHRSGCSDQSFHSFNADFDGDGHSITGLYADESEKEWSAGLFGHFGGKQLKNLTVDGCMKTRSDDSSMDAAGIRIDSAALALLLGTAGARLATVAYRKKQRSDAD